jgi:bacteriorhodopsin
LAKAAGGNTLAAHKICWFVLVGWAIYPLGYMLGTDGWYTGFQVGSVDAVYNIADAINKIGFGLVIYTLLLNHKRTNKN